MDMKQLLLRLGDKLVKDHGFQPAQRFCGDSRPKTTDSLVQFLVWLDRTPEAQEELESMGFSFCRNMPFKVG